MSESEYNETECARCGGVFHITLTRCPHCGVNIYEPDDLPPQDTALESVKDALRLPLAILVGWFITAFIGLLLYLPIRYAGAQPLSTTFLTLLATATLGVGAFAGGFLCQRIHQSRNLLGAITQVGFSILLIIVVFLTEGNILWSPLSVIGLGIMGALSYWGSKVANKILRQAMINDLFAPVAESQKHYQALLAKVGHDHQVVDRLIKHEREITPKATRDILIKNAIKRWEQDNRI